MAFAIRELGDADDMAPVAALFEDYRRVLLSLDVPIDAFQGFAEEIAHLPGKYSRAMGGALWLALDDDGGAAIGCIAIKVLDADCGLSEVKRLYVTPAARGRGVAKALCATAVDAARAAGCRRLVLDTLKRLSGAVELYAKLGFTPCEAYTHNPMPDVVFMHVLLSDSGATAAASDSSSSSS